MRFRKRVSAESFSFEFFIFLEILNQNGNVAAINISLGGDGVRGDCVSTSGSSTDKGWHQCNANMCKSTSTITTDSFVYASVDSCNSDLPFQYDEWDFISKKKKPKRSLFRRFLRFFTC